MTSLRHLRTVLLAGLAVALAGGASATAYSGGVISLTFAAGGGSCNRGSSTPLDTVQDAFLASLSTTCAADGSTASAALRASAAGAAVGLQLNATSSAVTAAQVSLIDRYRLVAPLGTPNGTYTLPVAFTLEGTVSPGAAGLGGRFLDYALSARDFYAGLGPTTLLSASGSVNATGAFKQTFAGTVDFRYFGPASGLPTTAEVELELSVPRLEKGQIDFFNTASLSMTLPPGWSVTTSSGLPVVFAPVPEPSAGLLGLAGLSALVALRRRQARSLRPAAQA